MPLVSIIMAVYNGEVYLEESISSLLQQSYQNFELILIDDASNDLTSKICKKFNDKRIKYFRNKTNIGLTKSLNKGIDHSSGKYLARQDCDDISKVNRLKIQVDYMESNPKTKILGTNCDLIDRDGNLLKKSIKMQLCHDQIRFYCMFDNPIIHSTVILKSSIIKNYNVRYDENYYTSQDYQLWARLVNNHKCENLKDKLIFYRVHNNSISSKYGETEFLLIRKIMKQSIFNCIKHNVKEDYINNWIKLHHTKRRLSLHELSLVFHGIKNLHKKFYGELDTENAVKKTKYHLQYRSIKQYIVNLKINNRLSGTSGNLNNS